MPTPKEINSLYRAVLLGAGLLLLGLLFRELVTLIVAILITVILSIPLAATAGRLERFGVPRFLGALCGLLIGIGALALILALVIPPFVEQTDDFVNAVPSTLNGLEERVGNAIGVAPPR